MEETAENGETSEHLSKNCKNKCWFSKFMDFFIVIAWVSQKIKFCDHMLVFIAERTFGFSFEFPLKTNFSSYQCIPMRCKLGNANKPFLYYLVEH